MCCQPGLQKEMRLVLLILMMTEGWQGARCLHRIQKKKLLTVIILWSNLKEITVAQLHRIFNFEELNYKVLKN